eukprot:gnl/Ergobibamus_cyprinoides/4282.p1 GENE.gnl/Ergobibamus_cyprinoides/4282~~gnl/Ergobibamus_cyprinoides/4282.p1  ORF type:complete len:143 (+),score=17.89 gnl/Ergobibamus_cyprinoides/4282:313-741(+)
MKSRLSMPSSAQFPSKVSRSVASNPASPFSAPAQAAAIVADFYASKTADLKASYASACDSAATVTRKNSRQFPKEATAILNQWYYAHVDKPYPSPSEKEDLAIRCGLSFTQVAYWFGNNRNRRRRRALKASRATGRRNSESP